MTQSFTPLLSAKPMPRQNCACIHDVIVIGSSVAFGQSAMGNRGWATLLAEVLKSKYSLEVYNAALPGSDTGAALETLQGVLAFCRPRAVVIGLAPANEGLRSVRTLVDAKRVATYYLTGLWKIIQTARLNGAAVMLGGVYPNGKYQPTPHAEVLHQIQADMMSWTYPVFDFLAAVEDSINPGQWKPGTFADAGHPNDLGHRLMFSAVDTTLFHPVKLPCPS